MATDKGPRSKDAGGDKKVTSPTADQEIRVAKQRAEAEAKGGGPRKSEKGLNQDG